VDGAPVAGTFTFTYIPGGSDAPVNAGTYSVNAIFTSTDPNYTNATSTTAASIVIAPAIPVVSVAGVFGYDGTSHGATTIATGVGGATVPGAFFVDYAQLASAPVHAGSYPVTAAFSSSDSNYANTSTAGLVVINRATPTVTVAGGTFAYDGNVHGAGATTT